jgi:uncharacterized protein with HEPN domain
MTTPRGRALLRQKLRSLTAYLDELEADLRRRFTSDYSGLRNRIVHDYDELDNAAVWRSARQLVPGGRALLAALIARVDAKGSA